MGKFRVVFNTDSAAFDGPEPTAEIERILHKIAEQVRSGEYTLGGPILDIDGNTIGSFEQTER